jgi:hypothetical protein
MRLRWNHASVRLKILIFPDAGDCPAAAATGTTRYGTATAAARGRLHQQLASRAGRENHRGELPVIEGTLIRLQADHLPGDAARIPCGCGPRPPAPEPAR